MGVIVLVVGLILLVGSAIAYYSAANSCNQDYYPGSNANAACVASYLPAVYALVAIGILALILGGYITLVVGGYVTLPRNSPVK
jgi:hypothetical protein